jgi:hypothetical protein
MPPDLARADWTVTDSRAVLVTPRSRCGAVRIDLCRPEGGLEVGATRAAGDRLLGLDLGGEVRLADAWARGGDLTAVYETVDARQVRATAMWRAIGDAIGAADDVAAWEVIVSAQTALLQSDAALAVTGDVLATTILHPAGGHVPPGADLPWHASSSDGPATARAILVRRATATGAAAPSVLVALHDDHGDAIAARIEDGHARIACRLFGETLEKGVLLRSRVLAAIGPADDDTTWAGRLVDRFAALPPMLDT